MDVMLVVGWNDAMDQLTMTHTIHWYGQVMRWEDGHVIRRVYG